MKKFIFLVVFFLLLTPNVSAEEELPELNTEHYFVQDNANILDDETMKELNEMGTHLEEGTGVEMLLMTMDTTGQVHRQDYALEVLRGYGVGKEDEDNGIVIFLNLDNGNEFNNRGIEVQVGYGVEGYLNDAKIGRIIDEVAISHFEDAAELIDRDEETSAKSSYQEGLKNLYAAVYEESLEAYGYEDGEFTREEPAEDEGSDDGSLFGTIFRVAFTLIILYVLFKFISGSGGGPRGGHRRRKGPVVFTPPSGRFGGSGGSGFGGGTGGFGGFGGGSGGGGGAGRGF